MYNRTYLDTLSSNAAFATQCLMAKVSNKQNKTICHEKYQGSIFITFNSLAPGETWLTLS